MASLPSPLGDLSSGKIKAVDLHTGQTMIVDLKKNIVSRSFQTKDPQDYLWDLVYLPQTVPSLNVCQASEEEIQHLLLLSRCQNTIVHGYRFEELFPSEAIAKFHDDRGMPLPGLRVMSRPGQDDCVETQIYQPSSTGKSATIGDQKRYILFVLIPKFAAWLAECFSTLCHYERAAMSQSQAEAERFWQGLESASAVSGAQINKAAVSGATNAPAPPPYAP